MRSHPHYVERDIRASRENVSFLRCPLSAWRTVGTELWDSGAIRRVTNGIIETRGQSKLGRPAADGAAVRLPHLGRVVSHERKPPAKLREGQREEEEEERVRGGKEPERETKYREAKVGS